MYCRQIAAFAERRDKGAVRGELVPPTIRGANGCGRARPHDRRHAGIAAATHRRGETEHRLPRADQLDIDLGQQLGVEQRAVLGPRELSIL